MRDIATKQAGPESDSEWLTLEQLRTIRAELSEFRGEMRAEFGRMRIGFDEVGQRFRILDHHVTSLRRD